MRVASLDFRLILCIFWLRILPGPAFSVGLVLLTVRAASCSRCSVRIVTFLLVVHIPWNFVGIFVACAGETYFLSPTWFYFLQAPGALPASINVKSSSSGK